MTVGSFDDFLKSIRRLGGTIAGVDPQTREVFAEVAATLQSLPSVSRRTLARLVSAHPAWVPILALCVGLSQEQLKNILKHRFGSAAWLALARHQAFEVIELLDGEFALVDQIRVQRAREWSFADILLERYASRSRAAGSIGRGRNVEDQVETVIDKLQLPRKMRTRFIGRAGQEGPCDIAIPAGGEEALIICAVKGYDSTGSKLTDAVGEIQRMAEVRLPRQFVFAIVDGIGWKSRQSDLRRIYHLWEQQSIDGLYSLAHLAEFRSELRRAAHRHRLLR